MKIRVLKGLATEAAFLREMRWTYETNRAVKAFGLWVLLKNESTSGSISLLKPGQINRLEYLTGKSYKTVQRWLIYAEQYGLLDLRYSNDSLIRISLKSNQEVSNKYALVEPTKYHELEYTPNETPSIDYLLKALELHENKEKQITAYTNKTRLNPIVNRAILIESENLGIPAALDGSPEELKKLQAKTFCSGGSQSATYEVLQNLINPDFQRTARRIAFAHRMKNPQSAVYMKRALAKRGLAKVTRRAPIVCNYSQDPLGLGPRGTKKHAFRRYERDVQAAVWFLPDLIELSLPWHKTLAPSA